MTFLFLTHNGNGLLGLIIVNHKVPS